MAVCISSNKLSEIMKSEELYLTCVSSEVVSYQITSCRSYSVKTRECHVSFKGKLDERRLVLLADDPVVMRKLTSKNSPLWIKATNNCDFEV